MARSEQNVEGDVGHAGAEPDNGSTGAGQAVEGGEPPDEGPERERLRSAARGLGRLLPGTGVAAGALLILGKGLRRVVGEAFPRVGDDLVRHLGNWLPEWLGGNLVQELAIEPIVGTSDRLADAIQRRQVEVYTLEPEQLILLAVVGVLLIAVVWWGFTSWQTNRRWMKMLGKAKPGSFSPMEAIPDPGRVNRDAWIAAGVVATVAVVLTWMTGGLPRRPIFVPLLFFVVVVPVLGVLAYGVYWWFVRATGHLVSVSVHAEGVTLRSDRRDLEIGWDEIRRIDGGQAGGALRLRLEGRRRGIRIPSHGHPDTALDMVRRRVIQGLSAHQEVSGAVPFPWTVER